MDNLKIATAQFEHRSNDKTYNLGVIEKLSEKASREGADVIAFHECSVTGYTFARNLTKEQMLDLAEFIPGGDSILKLKEIADKYNIVILAGRHGRLDVAVDAVDLAHEVAVEVAGRIEIVGRQGLVGARRRLRRLPRPIGKLRPVARQFQSYWFGHDMRKSNWSF